MDEYKPDMNFTIEKLLGQTDIYLIDQIMKTRYLPGDIILDAGSGNGRNMHWFINNKLKIFGVDSSEAAIINLINKYQNLPAENFLVANLESLPFTDGYFNHVICCAVLHFARSLQHFQEMVAELVRVTVEGGTLFMRMASDIGIEDKVKLLENGNYKIPDGSMRFLLTKEILAAVMLKYNLDFVEPLKTVNVNDLRCMSTLILKKNEKII